MEEPRKKRSGPQPSNPEYQYMNFCEKLWHAVNKFSKQERPIVQWNEAGNGIMICQPHRLGTFLLDFMSDNQNTFNQYMLRNNFYSEEKSGIKTYYQIGLKFNKKTDKETLANMIAKPKRRRNKRGLDSSTIQYESIPYSLEELYTKRRMLERKIEETRSNLIQINQMIEETDS